MWGRHTQRAPTDRTWIQFENSLLCQSGFITEEDRQSLEDGFLSCRCACVTAYQIGFLSCQVCQAYSRHYTCLVIKRIKCKPARWEQDSVKTSVCKGEIACLTRTETLNLTYPTYTPWSLRHVETLCSKEETSSIKYPRQSGNGFQQQPSKQQKWTIGRLFI